MAFMYYRAADTGRRDIYAPLPLINHERLKMDATTPFIPRFVTATIAGSSAPDQVYASRVQGRQILLENPARESKAKKEREEKRARRAAVRARKSVGAMSEKEASRRGIWKLRPEETKYQLFLPLHSLWLGYMSELLSLSPPPAVPSADPAAAMPSAAGMHAKLIKADFHGSIVTVRKSKNSCLMGLSGIVVHETENAFKVITQKDQQKLIPKQNSIFVFAVPLYATSAITPDPSAAGAIKTILDLPHVEFELYGNHFCYRAAERAGKKFKHKETIEL